MNLKFFKGCKCAIDLDEIRLVIDNKVLFKGDQNLYTLCSEDAEELHKAFIETAATAQHRCKGRCRPLQNARKSLERQGDAKCAERF